MPGLDKLVPVRQYVLCPSLSFYDRSGLGVRGLKLQGALMEHPLLISHGPAQDAAWPSCLPVGICGQCIVTSRTCLHTCGHMARPRAVGSTLDSYEYREEIPSRAKEHPCPMHAQDFCFLRLITVDFIELSLEHIDVYSGFLLFSLFLSGATLSCTFCLEAFDLG